MKVKRETSVSRHIEEQDHHQGDASPNDPMANGDSDGDSETKLTSDEAQERSDAKVNSGDSDASESTAGFE